MFKSKTLYLYNNKKVKIFGDTVPTAELTFRIGHGQI